MTALASADQRRLKVLLVDDVDLFVELEKTFFCRSQFEILTAFNGRQALELAQREKPALIFLDLYLPEMNGDEVCRHLKNNPETFDIPVIMVVQPGNGHDLKQCRDAFCDDILFKPVRREEFLRASRAQLCLPERMAPRADLCLPVDYGLRDKKMLSCSTVNVSQGGLFIACAAQLAIDTWVGMKLTLPDDQPPVQCRGRVAWLNHPDWIKRPQLPSGMGVEFVDIADKDLERLLICIEQSG
jgi:CheY-like chemotaxis protein/Tfp pilus assembly protein PilZ